MKNKAFKCLAACFSTVFVCVVALLVVLSIDVAAADCANGEHYWSQAGECIECGLACDHPEYERDNYTIVEPTCTAQGYTIYTCAECGVSINGDYTDATGHIYDQKNTNPEYKFSSATCTSPALYHYSCACGEEGTGYFTSGSALGHSWSSAGDCITCGVACDHPEYEPDNYTVIEPTCTTQGYTLYTCIDCKASVKDDYTDATGHTFDQKNTDLDYRLSAATCTSPAKYFYSCSCGEKGSTTFLDGSALGHSWSVAGECIECGLACDHQDYDRENYTVIEPTCTKRGYTKYFCLDCESYFFENYVDALGHYWSPAGECIECGLACDHKGCLGDAISTVPPTCVDKGYTLHKCSCCLSEVKVYISPTYEHTYDQMNPSLTYLVSAATCTSPAMYHWSCSCGLEGLVLFRYGSPLGHTWSNEGDCIACGKECNHPSESGGICTECGFVLSYDLLTDYFVHLDFIVGETELTPDLTSLNDSVKYWVDIQKDEHNRILLDGFCALPSGVDHYSFYIIKKDGTYIPSGPLINNYAGFELAEEQLNEIAQSGLNIYEYNENGRFQFYLDLDFYAHEDIMVYVCAFTNDAETVTLLELDIPAFENDETTSEMDDSDQTVKDNSANDVSIVAPIIAIVIAVSAVAVLLYVINKKPGKPGTKNKVRRKR